MRIVALGLFIVATACWGDHDLAEQSQRLLVLFDFDEVILGRWEGDKVALDVSTNVHAGLTGKQLECLVIDVEGRIAATVQRGSYWCGPWVPASP